MVLTFDDSLFVFKNYNILILYDYHRYKEFLYIDGDYIYYNDFKILFNLLIP